MKKTIFILFLLFKFKWLIKGLRMVDMKKNRDVLMKRYQKYLKELMSKREPSKLDLTQIGLISTFLNALFDLYKVDFE